MMMREVLAEDHQKPLVSEEEEDCRREEVEESCVLCWRKRDRGLDTDIHTSSLSSVAVST